MTFKLDGAYPIGHISQEAFINKTIKTRETKYGLNTNLISDGAHTFGELYHERATLFAIFMYNYLDLSRMDYSEEFYGWKSELHHDGDMYNGYFIVGITSKKTGKMFTYHYPLEYWNFFQVEELDRAPEWNPELDMSIDEFGKIFVPNYRPYKEG